MGEFAYGKNLNNANLFTTGGSGTGDEDSVSVETIGLWTNVTSKPLDFLNVVWG